MTRTTATIHVTTLDILLAIPNDVERCPISIALRRQDVFREPGVGRTCAFDASDPVRSHAWLPSEAREFVDRWDKGLPVDPFEFEIEWRHASPLGGAL